MKIEKSKFIISMILGIILVTMPQVYAKTSIEIKPNSGVYTNKTISEFFDDSIAMKDVGEGLESDNVDVHMATNADWAIVTWFSSSAYGTGKGEGVTTSISGNNYSSTNGNATGVMNWGKTYTYTAGVMSAYTEIPDTSTAYTNGSQIIVNASNNTHVDIIENKVPQKNIAVIHFNSWFGSSIEAPFSFRSRVL